MYNYYEIIGSVDGIFVWLILSAIVAIGGGITLYFLFLKSNKKFKNFLDKVRDFFNFKLLLLEEILKITYLILTIYVTLSSFSLITINFISFLFYLVTSNIVLRIVYELLILLIKICKNTTEINNKLKK